MIIKLVSHGKIQDHAICGLWLTFSRKETPIFTNLRVVHLRKDIDDRSLEKAKSQSKLFSESLARAMQNVEWYHGRVCN